MTGVSHLVAACCHPCADPGRPARDWCTASSRPESATPRSQALGPYVSPTAPYVPHRSSATRSAAVA